LSSRRTAVAILLAALLGAVPVRAEDLLIRWLGQSCFWVQTPDGVRVLMDPVPPAAGYANAPVTADVVTVSHDHPDHSYLPLAQGAFSVLRGVAPGGRDWNAVELEIGDARLHTVGSYHDGARGAERGLNAIFVLELPNFKLVHLGDLGHALEDGQVAALRGADAVLVPVGGRFTLDAAAAARVVDQLQPRALVIPMHYRTADSKVKELAPPDAFLKGRQVLKADGPVYKIDVDARPASRACVILNYR
jgi:L-ascorbate metabolism protein UlaG (beta-lactamase superfamily)